LLTNDRRKRKNLGVREEMSPQVLWSIKRERGIPRGKCRNQLGMAGDQSLPNIGTMKKH